MNEGVGWEERIDIIYKKFSHKISSYHHFRKWMMERKEVGYHLDTTIVLKCYNISTRIKTKNDDHFMVCVGMEGVGKSTFMLNVCSLIDPTFDCDRICYTLKQFLDFLKVCKPGEAVLIDEGGSVLYSRQAMSQRNVGLTKLFSIMRQKNLFVGIAIPNFYVLDSYVRMHRVNSIVNIDVRGSYRLVSDALNRVSITKINKEGADTKDVSKVKPVPGTGFRGNFSKGLPDSLDEQEYLDRKAEHMREIIQELDDMDEDTGLSKYIKVSVYAKKMGATSETVAKHIKEGKIQGKKMGSLWYVLREEFDKL